MAREAQSGLLANASCVSKELKKRRSHQSLGNPSSVPGSIPEAAPWLPAGVGAGRWAQMGSWASGEHCGEAWGAALTGESSAGTKGSGKGSGHSRSGRWGAERSARLGGRSQGLAFRLGFEVRAGPAQVQALSPGAGLGEAQALEKHGTAPWRGRGSALTARQVLSLLAASQQS